MRGRELKDESEIENMYNFVNPLLAIACMFKCAEFVMKWLCFFQ